MLGLVGDGAQRPAMMSFHLLRKKMSAITLLVTAMSVTIVSYVFLFVLGTLHITHIALLVLAAAIIFVGFGLATVLTTIFLADTVDYGEWKSQLRNESVIFSFQTFVFKLHSAISVFI